MASEGEEHLLRGWRGSVRLHEDCQLFVRRNMLEFESPNQALNRLLRIEMFKRTLCPAGWSWSRRVVCTSRAYHVELEVDGRVYNIPFLDDGEEERDE